jgi:ADP-ribose pyrophosphatase
MQKLFGDDLCKLVYNGFIRIWKSGEAKWEIVEKPDAVAIFICHPRRRKTIFVGQYRPAVGGKTYEVPAGHIEEKPVDWNLLNWVRQTMVREAKEEVGAEIDPDRILLIHNHGFCVSPGFTTEKIWFGYIEINDEDIELEERVFGLKEEGERITRHWVSFNDLPTLVVTGISDMKTLVLVNWFLLNKYSQFKKGKK